MKIITWNSRGFKECALHQLLNDSELDILCVQEFGEPHLLDANDQRLFPHSLDGRWNEVITPYSINVKGLTYNVYYWANLLQQRTQSMAIYVRSTIKVHSYFNHYINYGDKYWHERPLIGVVLSDVIVANSHGPSSDNTHSYYNAIYLSAVYLGLSCQCLTDTGKPWMNLGDFNITYENYDKVAKEQGYIYPFCFEIPQEVNPAGPNRGKIDYLTRLPDTSIVYRCNYYHNSFCSDHFPVTYRY